MALFVYITDECIKDARRHNHEQEVTKFRDRIEQEQRTTLFDNFPPPYLKKRFKRQIRLLAAERRLNNVPHVVVCFYRLMVRSSREYGDFINDPQGYGGEHFVPLVTDEDLSRWIEEKCEESDIPEKITPIEEELGYLWRVIGQDNVGADEVFVCETPDWVTAVTTRQLSNRLVVMCNDILDASEGNIEEGKVYLSDVGGQKRLDVLCRYFPTHRKLLLVSPFFQANQEEKDEIEKRYANLLERPESEISGQDILRESVRSYPNEVLLDEDFWLEIERDEEANLALSSEESELLQSVHAWGQDKQAKGFPLFINGRAGSGKSTILQYLFADYLRFYLQDNENNLRPLYLTCSGDLLNRSRAVVDGLIRCNYRSANRQIDPDELRENIEESFQEFHAFLLGLLPRRDRRRLFPAESFVDYGRFRDIWEEKFSRDPRALRDHGPDISWHVIRSYIKGLSADGYLDQDEYSEQPKGERTVTQEMFDTVYEKVWTKWYKPLCEIEDGQRQYWDDQDLVRYLLEQDLIKPVYPAIFCDEAQDFTRIELEVLLRLSIFSDRKLTRQEIRRVPFAFAGDPFQTLNPTGFRWDAIKAAFVLKFIHALDTDQQGVGAQDLNYHELNFNYRSTRNIVRLCNTIQALRSALFGISDIEPQATWRSEKSSPMPVWFERGGSYVLENLKKQTDLTIIVPCEEGEEKEFVENDRFLNTVIQRDDTGVPQNVLSPSRAKGLEFNRVALYGFGENAPEKLIEAINGDELALWEDPDTALPLEYFVNRLYVAASRPKRRLFVVDSAKGFDRLWRFAIEGEFQKRIMGRIRDGETIWQNHLGTIQKGSENSWEEDREDPAAIGARLEHDGRTKRDSFLMRQAGMHFGSSNNTLKETECIAYALLFEKQYEKSGERFSDCEKPEQSLGAFWEGSHFGSIRSLAEKYPQLNNRLEVRLASFLIDASSVTAYIQLLREIETNLDQPEVKARVLTEDSWRKALGRVVETVLDKNAGGDIVEWQKVSALSSVLLEKGIDALGDHLAEIKYRAQEFDDAIALWEEIGETGNSHYRQAKARILVGLMEGGGRDKLTDEEKVIVAEHYIQEKHFNDAALVFADLKDIYGIGRLLSTALQSNDDETAENLLGIFLVTLAKTGEWFEATHLLEKQSCKLIGREFRNKISRLMGADQEKWKTMLVQEIAVSNQLLSADNHTKGIVSRFLMRFYIKRRPGIWSRKISPELVGSAIERSGRNMDGLKFYEIIQEANEFDKNQKLHAANRWLVCKQRQIDHELSSGSKPHARKLEEDMRKKLDELGIKSVQGLPDLPKIDDLLVHSKSKANLKKKEAIPSTGKAGEPEKVSDVDLPATDTSEEGQDISPKKALEDLEDEAVTERAPMPVITSWIASRPESFPDKLCWQIEQLGFEYSQDNKRVNVENQQTKEIATIYIATRKCDSLDVKFVNQGGVFLCEAWGVSVDLRHLETSQILNISFPSLGVATQIALALT